MNDALKTLISKCKCGVFLTVNEHRDHYQSTAEWLEPTGLLEFPPEISDEVREGIMRTDTIVDIQFYPDTPVGFYRIVHYDIDEALRRALECLG